MIGHVAKKRKTRFGSTPTAVSEVDDKDNKRKRAMLIAAKLTQAVSDVDTSNPHAIHYSSITVPTNFVGWVIGKGGTNITRIKAETGCHVQVSRDQPKNEDVRDFQLKGTQDQIRDAKRQIQEIVDNAQRMHSQVQEAVWLPANLIGLIIGKGGENINRLKSKYNCFVQIDQYGDIGTTMRECQIKGEDMVKRSTPLAEKKMYETYHIGAHFVQSLVSNNAQAIIGAEQGSGVTINLDPGIYPDGTQDFTLTGQREQIRRAKEIIESITREKFGQRGNRRSSGLSAYAIGNVQTLQQPQIVQTNYQIYQAQPVQTVQTIQPSQYQILTNNYQQPVNQANYQVVQTNQVLQANQGNYFKTQVNCDPARQSYQQYQVNQANYTFNPTAQNVQAVATMGANVIQSELAEKQLVQKHMIG